MSSLRVNSITARAGSGTITVPAGNKISGSDSGSIYAPGMIIQTVIVRSDNRVTFSSAVSGNGTPITDLNITITPKFSNSIILCQWMLNGEISNDNVFLIWKNGALASNGYNQQAGNVRWSGYVSAAYDNDVSTTQNNWKIMYSDTPGSTSSQTYGLACRSSGPTASTFYLNRTVASVGADTQENTVSFGVLQEIAQ